MAAKSYVPKIQYKNVTLTGDTHTNTTVDDLSSTANIQAGMTVVGSGIPTGATVISVDSGTAITISAAATTSLNNTSLEFYHLVSFSYPPVDDDGEQLDAIERRSVSISGLTQVSIDYTQGIRKVKYRFLTEAQLTVLQTFFNNHAKLGEAFKYFESQEVASSVDYELSKFEFKPKRVLYKAGANGFLYDLEFNYRRVAS